MRHLINILILVILISCNYHSNDNTKGDFVRNKQLLNVIDDEIDRNSDKKIVMLIFVSKNDTDYIFTSGTNNPPTPILRKNDKVTEKIGKFDIPFYKYDGYYILYGEVDFKLDINDFLVLCSVIHNPEEINSLRPNTEEELSESMKRPIYNVYYINSKNDIIYLGKRRNW